MKLIIVTCLAEDQKKTAELFGQSGIAKYSASDTIGYKAQTTHHLLEEWFSSGSDQFDSRVLFSFAAEEQVHKAFILIKEFNKTHPSPFPLQAFILPVDLWSGDEGE